MDLRKMMIISMVLLAGAALSEASAQGVRDTLVALCDTVILSRIDTTAQACADTTDKSARFSGDTTAIAACVDSIGQMPGQARHEVLQRKRLNIRTI